MVDLVLCMTVFPGFGGQSFMGEVMPKVRLVRDALVARSLTVDVEVDGGIDLKTIKSVFEAGADTFVAGNAIFSAKNPQAEIEELRSRCAIVV